MRGGVLAALVLLSGCAFGAEHALFDVSEGAAPFADGQRMQWIESSNPGQRLEVTFRRTADGSYTITSLNDPNEPIRGAILVPIEATPEEDYVAQLRLNQQEASVALAFMWREGDRFRVVYSPGSLLPDDDLSAADPYCRWQTYQGCTIARREDVFAVYRALIYPHFVAGDATPESYLDIVPLNGPSTRPTKGPRK